MDGHLDAAAADLASRQHGLATVEQLRSLGATRAGVRSRVDRGQWVKVAPTVIRIAGAPITWQSSVLAAVLGAGSGAVASHRTAAALWELDGCRPGGPEITVPRRRCVERPGVRVHRSTDLHLVSPVLRGGIPTTPVGRTLLDLGAVLRPTAVQLAVDDARRRGLADWDGLLGVLVAHARRGRGGVATLRGILDEHFGEVAVTDSGFERLVLTLLCEAGLPKPVLQHEVRVGTQVFRLDLAYPEAKVGVELDGAVHLRRDVWEADHGRQNVLTIAGWRLLRFTWRDYLDHSGRLVAEVRSALGNLAAERS